MEANDGRCKMVVGKMGTPDFDIASYSNSRNNLLGKAHTEEKKVAEEVWEPPVEIEDSETVTSIDSAYWFISQSSDCLISEEEKEQQNMVLSAAESVKKLGQQ